MISSAVAIPEQDVDPTTNGTSPSLKRKLSQSLSTERKRPRVDTDTLNYDDSPKTLSPEAQVQPPKTSSSTTASPNARRRSSAIPPSNGPNSAVEEKQRNKRLFGSLLGTLAGKTSSTTGSSAHRKRDEIEARQRERLKQQNEEQEAERRRKREEVVSKRRREQERWEKEGQKLRWESLRAQACSLKTKTQPSLFYKPWELRPEEEGMIRKQKQDVEQLIRRETGEIDTTVNEEQVSTTKQPPPTEENISPDHVPEVPVDGTHEEAVQNNGDKAEPNGHNEAAAAAAQTSTDSRQNGNDHNYVDDHKDDEHHGEELVEGQEDDVIY